MASRGSREHDPLVGEYSHEKQRPREKEALHTLRKVASLVKPIMRGRNWKVGTLAEFYPAQHNLLGLNINHGQKICLRLRYPGDATQFLPLEQVVDTMLHELCHNEIGPHNAAFNALWDQLRREYESLVTKGYTGEGFLSEGKRLGGRRVPLDEVRRQARMAAEKRQALHKGSGQRLGGAGIRPGQDVRQVIVNAIERRNTVMKGCGSGNQDSDGLEKEADEETATGFKTKAEEDTANDQAIAEALWEMIQEERARDSRTASSTAPPVPLASRPPPVSRLVAEAEAGQKRRQPESPTDIWACPICTCHNPLSFLCCDACGTERFSDAPQKRAKTGFQSDFWTCRRCSAVMETQWWTCSACGLMKESS